MFYKNRSIIRQLILLRLLAGGTPSETLTVTGVSPLSLVNAIAHRIVSLTQYGKCAQDGANILCNNGKLAFGKPLTIDPTRYYAYISTNDKWSYSADSYSIVVPVTVGKKYKITADPTTPVDGGSVNVILRWGFVDTVYDGWKQSDVVPPSMSITIYDWVRSTPQDTQSVEVTATHPFMVIQMGAAAFASNLANGRIGVAVQEVYADGTPETLTVSGKNVLDSTPYKVGYYIDADGVEQAASTDPETYSIRQASVKPSTQYTLSYTGTITGYNQRWHAYDKDGNWLSQIAANMPSSIGQRVTATFTTPSNCYYVRQGGRTQEDYQIELGSTVTAYEAFAAQTVTGIPNLFSTLDGSVKDEVDLVSGVVTRRTEAVYEDGEIVVKALAEPVTEQVEPQHLSTAQGTNTVTAVTNVDPVTLKAEYKGVAA